MDEKKVREAIKRWEAMIINYSKDAKGLKSQIKKEFEEALEYFNNIKV